MDTWDSGERYSFVVRTPEKFNKREKRGKTDQETNAVLSVQSAVRLGGEGCAAKHREKEGPSHCCCNDADPPGCTTHTGTQRDQPVAAQQRGHLLS